MTSIGNVQRAMIFCGAVICVATLLISIGCNQNTEFIGLTIPSVLPLNGFRQDDEDPALDPSESGTAEELLKDWPKPDFALFVSGRQHGYLEPCGCITLALQKGGMLRRHTVQKILLKRGWDLVSIDAGNQVKRFGQQPVIKLRHTYQALCQAMNYQAIGLGVDDLKLPTIDLIQVMADSTGTDNPFVCANVDIMQAGMQSPFIVVEINGKKIGITQILGDEHIAELKDNSELTLLSVKQGLDQTVTKLLSEKCDVNVLVAQTGLDECRELAKQYPVFDVLITAGGAGDPTMLPEYIETNPVDNGFKSSQVKRTAMIQVGVKGMYAGIVAFYEEDGQLKPRYKRVPLDARYQDSDQIKSIFLNYQNELKQLYLNGQLTDIKPRQHPTGHQFVGSETCMDCHDEEFEIWEEGTNGEGGPHFRATLDLTDPGERTWVKRNYDPECLSCHVTGWNPQKYYPYESGFISLAKDPHLSGNGCENCHGPGSAHVEAENDGADEAVLERLRLQMRLTLDEARESACMECHDHDNSPPFFKEGAFERYWKKIEH
ncbi:MAG: hypothetical protein MK106_02990 [Mariniblastus sp.]|nr:hypothetical protein [Mariniblastus sp.]